MTLFSPRCGLLSLYLSKEDYNQAIDYLEKSLTITREIGDSRGEGAALESLGSAYRSLQEYNLAMNYYQQSLAIAKKIGDLRGEEIASSDIAWLSMTMGVLIDTIEDS